MIKPKRNKHGELIFEDYPDFRPNLTPYEVFKLGSFGSTYWREIYSSVTHKWYKDADLEFDWKDIPRDKLIKPWSEYDKNSNKYKVKVGTTLEFWESNGWIHPQDPYGFGQWFCRFYAGRRTDDDKRQIKRWLNTAGPNSRFRKRLINMIKKSGKKYNDYSISPAIRQTLQHWFYEILEYDLNI